LGLSRKCRHHEVSILIFGATGVTRCFGCCPRKKVSMMRMRLPQQGARMLWCFWFLGLGVGRLDGIDWDEGYCEQSVDTRDIFGAGATVPGGECPALCVERRRRARTLAKGYF
jgi:hypothetical protein